MAANRIRSLRPAQPPPLTLPLQGRGNIAVRQGRRLRETALTAP